MTTPTSGGPLINVGDFGQAANTLVERASDAIGGLFKPWQIRRIAEAEAQADKIHAVSQLQITELQKRAAHRWFHEEAQRQANMESITQKALPEVAQDAKPEQIRKDWFTDFYDHCRLISGEQMRVLWAKVLAGEANKPGSFSKRSVALLSSLGKSDAELFKTLCSFGWFIGMIIPLVYDLRAEIYKKAGIHFSTVTHLADIGLIRFSAALPFMLDPMPQKLSPLSYYGTLVAIEFPNLENNQFGIGNVMFSEAGGQLAPICGSLPQAGFLEYIVEHWRKQGLKVEVVKPEQTNSSKQSPGESGAR